MDSVTKVRTYNKDDDKQMFKLVKAGDKFFIESKTCAGREGSHLSALDCTEQSSDLVLGPKEVRHGILIVPLRREINPNTPQSHLMYSIVLYQSCDWH